MEHKLCVLIDFENLAAGTEKEGLGRFDVRAVFRRLKDKGRILVSRSYGDWGRFARFKQKLLEEGVTMVELTSYRGAEKNRADIALVVDAMEIAYTRPHLDTFVLLSGDSDFTPLVMRLKELDKRVIGIGTRGSTSRLLVELCDEFMFYESLRKAAIIEAAEEEDDDEQPTRAPPAASLSRETAFALLVETMAGVQKDEPGPVQGGLIKQGILRKAPAFDENELGYPTFARFLEQAQERGLVRLVRDEKAGGYRVDQPGSSLLDAPPASAPHAPEPAEDEDSAGPLVELSGEAARLQGVLIDAGVPPVGHMARHTVVHEFVDHVVERQQRKKRNTLTYVYGDIARRCRKTDPVVPARVVRAVINALKIAGELVHTSGEPVRSATANFVLQKDADDLLKAIRQLYVSTLLERGERLADGRALSELIWNDDQHEVDAGELVAFTQRKMELGQLRPPVVFEEGAAGAPEPAPQPHPGEESDGGGRGRRRRSDRRGGRGEGAHEERPSGERGAPPSERAPVTAAADGAALVATAADGAAPAEAPPTEAQPATPPTLAEGSAVSEASEAAPAPRRRRSTRTAEAAATEAPPPAEAPAPEKPARGRRRRSSEG